MITPGREERLGKMALYLMIARRAILGPVLLILAAVFLGLNGILINSAAALMTTSGMVQAQAAADASSIVADAILLLFVSGCLITFVGCVIAWVEYRAYTYTIAEFDLVMRNGIFDRKETSIPYRQIQDVNIERDLAQQLLGLSRLVMQTAGHEESHEHEMAEVVLEPINKEVAEEIRSMLERKIGVQITEDEKAADTEA